MKYPISVEKKCELLDISIATFYRHRHGDTRKVTQHITAIKEHIEQIFWRSGGTFGYRRILHVLKKNVPEVTNFVTETLVRRVMKQLHLIPCHERIKRRRYRKHSNYNPDMKDLLNRDFTAEEPGKKLVGDITYIPTIEGHVLLATVIDCYNREIIGHAFSTQADTAIITSAIAHARKNQKINPQGATFHSDRGSNYTSTTFRKYLTTCNITPSVGATGSCYDNALAESFFSNLKTERTHQTKYDTLDHAITDTTTYINWYNNHRPHSHLQYKTPTTYNTT